MKPLKILYIEDDHGCLKTMARHLTLTGGHAVEVAETGEEGLRKACSLKPDIILLDLMLPDMNGRKILSSLEEAESTRQIPVILITGAVLESSELELLRTGYRNLYALEQKPPDFARLLKNIEYAAQTVTRPKTFEERPL